VGKIKLYILALVAMAVLMGAGYAAWGQNVTVGGTVNTGKKDVGFTRWVARTDEHMTSSISRIDARTVQVTVNNLYPGGRVWIDVDITNTGTIPCKFESAALTIDPQNPLAPYLKSWCWLRYDEDGPGGPKPTNSYGYVQHPWGPFTGLADALNQSAMLNSLILDPGGWISFEADGSGDEARCICIKLDESAPNTVQNKSLTFNLQLNFKQWNR